MIPREEGDIFAAEGARAVERGDEAVVGEGGEGFRGDAAGVEFIGMRGELFGMDSEGFEDIEHERFEEVMSVLATDIFDEALGGMGSEGVEFQESIASFFEFGLEVFAGYLSFADEPGGFGGGFVGWDIGGFHGEVMDRAAELAEEFIAAFEVGFECVEALVVPFGEDCLGAAGDAGEVDMDGL